VGKHLHPSLSIHTNRCDIELEGEPFHLMPYPHVKTKKEALNVGHFEVAGAVRDNGRKIEERDSEIRTKHHTVMGHLHTCHWVRNTWYSGTLYQTTFGESMPKFFHHCKWEDGHLEVQNIPFKPPWELINLTVERESDLDSIDEDPRKLYKLFVIDGLDLDINDILTTHTNVVRHNKFKDKNDLKELIAMEWEFDDVEAGVNESEQQAVVQDLLIQKHKLTPEQIERGFKRIKQLTSK
jgi:hypothetical protein